MIKSTQIKIILIIILLATIMFGALGFFSITRLEQVQNLVTEKEVLMQETYNLKMCLIIVLTSFIIISLVIIWFTRNIISKPILKLGVKGRAQAVVELIKIGELTI